MSAGYIGRYRVLGELGRGAMGVVYRAVDETLDREVALKMMSAAAAGEEEAKRRFLREGRAAGRLQHPNIVTIFELGEHQGAPYMAMEVLEGKDLQQAIKGGMRPNPRVTLPIIQQVLAGLGHAHDNGIVHRDIKPSNVFLPRGRPAKIMDFGIARLTQGGTMGNAVTSTGAVIGTPNYMSPEQVRGATVDQRSDLFSTGLILYELVTGERAYQAESIVSVMFRIAQGPPDLSLISSAPDWARLRSVLQRALAHDPAERYAEAREFESELGLALVDLGGAMDVASASDRGFLRTRPVSSTPTPAPVLAPTVPFPVVSSSVTQAMPAAAPPTEAWAAPVAPEVAPASGEWSYEPPQPAAEAPRRTYRHAPASARAGVEPPPPSSSGLLWLGIAAALLVIVGGGVVAWQLVGGGLGSRPAPTQVRQPPATVAPATQPSAASSSAPVTMAQGPSTAPAATPSTAAPRRSSAPPPTVVAGLTGDPEPQATREPPREPAPETTEALVRRLERGNDAFENGRFAQALADARAVLARSPGNAQARALAEDAEAAIAVEAAIKNARQAMQKGDNDAALQHVRAGLAVAPSDGRLLALFRQLNQ